MRRLRSQLKAVEVRKRSFIELYEEMLEVRKCGEPPTIAFIDLCIIEHEFLLKNSVLQHSMQRVKHQKILYYVA